VSSEEYDERFLVECQVCQKKMRIINHFHLKWHELSVDEYRARFPDAPTSRIPCIECGTMIEDSLTVNQNYCEDCFKDRRKRMNRERKRKTSRELHRNLSPDDRKIIGDHHYPGLGTTEPTTFLKKIEVNGDERVQGAVYLEQWRANNGIKHHPRIRPEEMSD